MSAILYIAALAALGQTQAYPDGYATPVSGSVSNVGLSSFAQSPVDLWVAANGTGGNCSVSNPCQPQVACNKVPLYVTNRITIHVDGGLYNNGMCVLEGRTILSGQTDGGAYVDFEGSPQLSSASPNTGTVASSVQTSADTPNTPASLTVQAGGGGWADGGLFGLMVSMNTGASAGQIRAIWGNTATQIFVGGLWGQSQPANGDTFTIIDPCVAGGTFIDGGINLSVQTPGVTDTINWTAESVNNGQAGNTAFLFANDNAGQSLTPGFWGPGPYEGGIRVRGFCEQNAVGEFVTIRNSSGVWVSSNSVANMLPASGGYVTIDHVGGVSVDGNVILDVSSDVLLGVTAQPSGGYPAINLIGNVLNKADILGAVGLAFVGNVIGGAGSLVGKSTISLNSQFNYSLNAVQGPVWGIGSCIDCTLVGDIALNVNDTIYGPGAGGGYAVSFGCGDDGLNCLGVGPSDARIYGGTFTAACADGCGGIQVTNGMFDFHSGPSAPTQGTSVAANTVGVSFTRNAFVIVNAPGGATLTGAAGDTNFGGQNTSWASVPNPGRIVDLSSLSYIQEGVFYGGSRTSGIEWGSQMFAPSLDAGTINVQTLNVGGVPIDSSPDLYIQFDDPVTVTSNTSDFQAWGPTNHSLTLKNCSCSVPTPGTGTGTETWKVTSGAAGTGTIFITVVVPCTAIAGANCTSCTVNNSAVPTNTTLHAAVTTACSTADVPSRIQISATEP